jgi:hypothetical protein
MSTYRQTITEMFVNYERVREQRDRDSDEWLVVDTVRRGPHERGIFETGEYGFVVYDIDDRMVMDGYGEPDAPTYFDAWTPDENELLGTWEVGNPEGVLIRTYAHSCAE